MSKVKIPAKIRAVMQEVTQEEVVEKRLSGMPGIVIKIGDVLYFVSAEHIETFPKYILGEHHCGRCNKLYGSKCRKVWDQSRERNCPKLGREREEIELSKRIEKYAFITCGVELFNVDKEFFVVAGCRQFRPEQPRREKKDPQKIARENIRAITFAELDKEEYPDVMAWIKL